MVGSEELAIKLSLLWFGLISEYGDDLRTPAREIHHSAAEELRRTQAALRAIDDLLPLLDKRLAWLTSIRMPGFSDGPEVAQENEARVLSLREQLQGLRSDIAAAIDKAPPPERGAPMRPTPLLMIVLYLMKELKDAGIAHSTAENSKMVQTMRILWTGGNLEGDPRDMLRTLEKRGGK